MRMRRLSGLEEHLRRRRTSDIRLSEGTSSNEAAMVDALPSSSSSSPTTLVVMGIWVW